VQFKVKSVVAAVALALSAPIVTAQAKDPVRTAVEKAVLSNPEVTARFNAYRAALDAVDVASGAFRPRLDLNASVGRDSDRITSRNPESQSLSRTGVGLSLTQLLWDGMGTRRDVERAGHEKLTRYFELLDVTEQTALEAARAHYDVLRFKHLVQLADENYVQHRFISQQIQSRFQAGVGRGVDLEQANARLALAESNLNTETANLHDVSARYLRVVGDVPPKGSQQLTLLDTSLPEDANEVLNTAVQQSVAISASIESLRAARASVQAREGAYQPRVEARLRSGAGNNFDGVRDQKRDSAAEIVLNWNLYNGGADQARVRQQTNIVNQAADLRDKTCRDTRQTVAIAYNDTRKLADQLVYLDRNTLAIEKARDAYRQQFDIGQRSLLDLLNAENELYTAKRAYANAEYDRAVAYVRTHAGMSQLAAQLGLARPDSIASEAAGWGAGEDVPMRCPAQAIVSSAVGVDTLSRTVPGVAPVTAHAVSQSTGITAAPATPSVPLPVPVPVTPSAQVTAAAGMPTQRLNDWVAAWESKNVARYLSFYAPGFAPSDGRVDAWKTRRAALVGKKGPVSVKVSELLTTTLSENRIETRFKQTYRSSNFNDVTAKVLIWQRFGDEWKIVKETNR
jgi:adhesin transport system outer membrane protein